MLSDLRQAVRGTRRSATSSIVVVLCLALGLTVTTTMFGIANAIAIRPLPFPRAERLVVVRERMGDGGPRGSMSLPDYVDFRAAARAFSGFGAYRGGAYNVATPAGAEYVEGSAVSPSLFPTLGVAPALGRGFAADEDRPGHDRVVLLDWDLWQRLFDGAPGAVGRTVLVNGTAHTIVGVMPRGFAFPQTDHLWTPLVVDPARDARGDHAITGIARLRDGASIETARAELEVVGRRLATAYPSTNATFRPVVSGMHADTLGEMRIVLAIFQVATLLVLLVACANAANVIVARSAGRARELATRSALGAGRARLVALVLYESTALALIAAALALVATTWAIRAFDAAIPAERPYWLDFSLDPRVFAYALGAALLAGAAAGLPAALRASRPSVGLAAAGARTIGAGAAQARMRGSLVVVQLALSLVLVVGASLLGRSIVALQQVDPGFETAGVTAMRVQLVGAGYESAAGRAATVARLVDRLGGLPNVSAAAVGQLPMRGGNTTRVRTDGVPSRDPHGDEVTWNGITPGFLRVMGIGLRAGRDLAASEARDSSICLVNETMARQLWPGRSAVGAHVRFGLPARTMTVVGVVADIKQFGLNDPAGPQVYVPLGTESPSDVSFVVRDARASDFAALGRLAPALRRALREVAPGLAAVDVTPMSTVVRDAHWQPKVFSALFAAFGVAALLLAAVGVYGVTAYAVTQRTREIGVRRALGAGDRDVVSLVARRGVRLAIVGLSIGIVLALGAAQALRGLLFGVRPLDPVVFLAAPLFLGLVAFAANVIPARRATRVEPTVALRSE